MLILENRRSRWRGRFSLHNFGDDVGQLMNTDGVVWVQQKWEGNIYDTIHKIVSVRTTWCRFKKGKISNNNPISCRRLKPLHSRLLPNRITQLLNRGRKFAGEEGDAQTNAQRFKSLLIGHAQCFAHMRGLAAGTAAGRSCA